MKAYAPGEISQFKWFLRDRMRELAKEENKNDFFMPVGIFLVIDERNGGDITAQELVKRFNLLNFESQNILDFYFLGWRRLDEYAPDLGICFDFEAFKSCRRALKEVGIKKFGGNADLILVDAHYSNGAIWPPNITLDFTKAIRVDLSDSRVRKDFNTLGDFLQSIIETAEKIKKSANEVARSGIVFSISDKLGLATSKKSFLDFIMEKWGSIIGAKKLAAIAVRQIGPMLPLQDLEPSAAFNSY